MYLQAIKNDNSDLALVARWVTEAQAGDKNAFALLYGKFNKKLYLFCRRMIGDVGTAEEVTQECFIKAWLALPNFRNEGGFYAWLRQIASRIAIDKMRLKDAKVWNNRVEFDDADFTTRLHLEQSLDLEKMIGLLPEGARSVLVLHDIEGYAHAEIATMTGIAEGTSKAQLSRARRLLRANLTNASNEKTSTVKASSNLESKTVKSNPVKSKDVNSDNPMTWSKKSER